MKKKVLVLEVDFDFYEIYGSQAESRDIEVLFAQSVGKGRQLLKVNPDVAAICVGTRIQGNLDFVYEVRAAHPTLPIVGVSVIKGLRNELKGAGCNYEVSNKLFLFSTVAKIIHGHQQ